jgi:hypothetical protein
MFIPVAHPRYIAIYLNVETYNNLLRCKILFYLYRVIKTSLCT